MNIIYLLIEISLNINKTPLNKNLHVLFLKVNSIDPLVELKYTEVKFTIVVSDIESVVVEGSSD